MLRNVTRESEADFRKRPCGKQPKRPCGKQPREDERSEVKFGFGSKVRGRRPETQRKTAAKQFAGGFPVAGIAHPPGRANPKHVKGPDRGFKSQETDNGYSPTMAWR